MDRQTFDGWLSRFGETWMGGDADGFAGLFSEDATYKGNPFQDVVEGRSGIRDYIARIGQNNPKIVFGYEILAVTPEVGITQWTANISRPDAGAFEMDGILAITLDSDGLCTSLREWVNRREAEA